MKKDWRQIHQNNKTAYVRKIEYWVVSSLFPKVPINYFLTAFLRYNSPIRNTEFHGFCHIHGYVQPSPQSILEHFYYFRKKPHALSFQTMLPCPYPSTSLNNNESALSLSIFLSWTFT